jgi:hypothetical protein
MRHAYMTHLAWATTIVLVAACVIFAVARN